MRHGAVVGQQLLGVFGQAVAAVAKAGVVVVAAYARVQAHAVDDLAGVKRMARGIGVQLVKKRHTHGQIGVGKELDGLCLGAAAQQHVYVLFDGALLQQCGKGLGPVAYLAHHNAAGVQVVKQRFAFAQKLGAKDDVGAAGLRAQFGGVAHRHGAFDNDNGLGVDGQHVLHHGFYGCGVECVGNGVVVCGGGYHHVAGASVGLGFVQRGA